MKANYPLVFYTTMLNGNLDEADAFITEARKLGIEILPPHVNYSKLEFEIEGDNKIRAGFNIIKGIGPKAVDVIVENQPFSSINDFSEKTGKTCNKKVWEALIKHGAFDGLGIEVEQHRIPEEYKNSDKLKFELTCDENLKHCVVLNRKQLELWYEKVQEENSRKAPPNYLVPESLIPGKFLNNPEYELVPEKDGSYVVPEDKLELFKIDPSMVQQTRKKPKGMFVKNNIMNIPVFERALIFNIKEISDLQITNLDIYLEETSELGFSFLEHPLEKIADKLNVFENVPDGCPMITAGIIESMQKRFTKNNKPYYWITLKTPRDKVRVTVWDNQYKQHINLFTKHNLIAVKGVKGFGGITMEDVKEMKMKK